jgi:adenine-specific DNA methylase
MAIAVAPTPQKLRGAYYTPRPIADFLTRWAVREASDRVLDPACGDAVFLQSAADRLGELGHRGRSGQVVGFEIDRDAAAESRRAAPFAAVVETDFFAQAAETVRFDAIVGNPPYIRYHHFAGDVRTRALERAAAEGVVLSALTSSWAPFVVHAASFLAPQGRLAFVLPAELLSTDYAAPVREFLRARFGAVHVVAFEQRVFPNALVDVVLVLAEGDGPGEVHVHRLPAAAALERFSFDTDTPFRGVKWTEGLLPAAAVEGLAHAAGAMRPLGQVASVDIGVVTGANAFFLLTDRQATDRGLRRSDLRPVVARGHQIPGVEISRREWAKRRSDGELVWLFTPRSAEEAAVRAYVAEGEAQGVQQAYKCRVRSPWWRLKVPAPPDLLLTYMSNHVPRLVANGAGVLTTNLIHNVRLATPARDARGLALAWTNSATMLSAELVGRAYGGGVLKLETREAERVLIPKLPEEQARELEEQAAAIDRLLRGRQFAAVADLVDPVVLAHLSPSERAVLRSAWNDLRQRRRQRSAPAAAA